MKYTNQEIIQSLQDYYKDTGMIPKHATFRTIHPNVIAHRFKTWLKALYAAGLVEVDTKVPATVVTQDCKHCGNKFDSYERDSREFCSTKCSNESRRGPKWNTAVPRDIWLQTLKQKSEYNLTEADFETLGWDTKRKRVIFEQDGKCGECGLKQWRGIDISLEVDHIDGDNKNHHRNNLIGLCPNCHSCTPTWRGRNVRRKKKWEVSDEQLIAALKSEKNVRQALLKVGLVAKGANYRRAKLLQDQIFNVM